MTVETVTVESEIFNQNENGGVLITEWPQTQLAVWSKAHKFVYSFIKFSLMIFNFKKVQVGIEKWLHLGRGCDIC